MRACSALLLPLLLTACSSPAETLSPTPVALDVAGGFRITVREPDRLVVASADGRVLLDGLPPGNVAHDYDPPLVGFAIRDVTTTYEMQFGAFKPTMTASGPWKVAETVSPSGSAVDLLDASGVRLARIRFQTPEEGHLVAAIEPGEGPARHFSWGFACSDDDHFAGFGAQSLDVDHRGFTVPTWVQEQGIGKADTDDFSGVWFVEGRRHSSQIPIPQYLSRRGYVLTAETDLRAIFALCSEPGPNGEKPAAARVELDLPASIHLFDGPSPAAALARSSATFGRPRMPPRVAFAPWLDGIYGSQNVRSVAQKARAEGIPSSVIWSEDWRGGGFAGDNYTLKEDWDVDPTLYPDMKSLSDDLHSLGFDFHVYFNPFVYVGSKAWDETAPFGLLVKKEDGTPYTFTGAKFTDTGLIDLDNPAGFAWAVKKMRDAIALGADGWMNDFAEWLPTDAFTFIGPSLPRHNPYAVKWQMAAREAIDSVHDGQERLFFSRSGWFGTPALADVVWAGDQRTDFEVDDGLPTVLPIGIGLGIVGISTYGHDIAGYQSATNPPTNKELFFRWTELGAWSPVMRTHHGTVPKKEHNWTSDAESTDHFRRHAKLHMALVPYLEGLAKVASETGLPMWRGLMLRNPEDAAVWPIVDEVLLGDGILLAPVMTAGATSRSVYLPAGTWYPWDGGAPVAGGAMIEAAAPLDSMPVYAAAGALVSMYPDGVMTLTHGSAAAPDAASVGDDRVVMAFLGASGSFREAGGLGYAIEHTASATGTLAASWNGSPLAACDDSETPPCTKETADGLRARVTSSGALTITANGQEAAVLRATGGKAERVITWVVRR